MNHHAFDSFDAATIHEAYGERGSLPSAIKPIDPLFCVRGSAFTVDCPPNDNLWIHRALYAAQAGDVLVVHTRGALEAGYWGEVLTEAAVTRQLAGLVIDGGVRDAGRLIEIGFPVFAANICVRGTTKRPDSDGRIGVPLTIGTTVVCPGDAVLGDRDGVVVVAADVVAEVAAAAAERVIKERTVIERLRDGETTLAIYGFATGEE